MNPRDVAIMLNAVITLIEILIRMKESARVDISDMEEMDRLKKSMARLKKKPKDYLQKWDG